MTQGRRGAPSAGECSVPNSFWPLAFGKLTARTSDMRLPQPRPRCLLQILGAPVERLDLAPERLLDRTAQCARRVSAPEGDQVRALRGLVVRGDLHDQRGTRVPFRLGAQ